MPVTSAELTLPPQFPAHPKPVLLLGEYPAARAMFAASLPLVFREGRRKAVDTEQQAGLRRLRLNSTAQMNCWSCRYRRVTKAEPMLLRRQAGRRSPMEFRRQRKNSGSDR